MNTEQLVGKLPEAGPPPPALLSTVRQLARRELRRRQVVRIGRRLTAVAAVVVLLAVAYTNLGKQNPREEHFQALLQLAGFNEDVDGSDYATTEDWFNSICLADTSVSDL